MATRVVTFLSPGGPPSARHCQHEFEGTRGPSTRNHLAAVAARVGGPCTVLALGSPAARERWQADGLLAEGWTLQAPALRLGFRELMPGGNEGDRWAGFTALATALAETPLGFEPLDAGSATETQAPAQILIDITYAQREVPFLAATVVAFMQGQRRRNNAGQGPSLRVLYADTLAPGDPEVVPFVELTQLLHVLSWEAPPSGPRPGLAARPGEPPSTDRLSSWSRRARTIPAVPWALGPTPRALNLTSQPWPRWPAPQQQGAQALGGALPIELAGLSLDLAPTAPLADVEALADQLATRALDEQPTLAFVDAETTLALALVARLQRAGVRCLGLVRSPDGAFASWREFPTLGG